MINQRLIFIGHALNIGQKEYYIPLSEITYAQNAMEVKQRKTVELNDNVSVKFCSNCGNEILTNAKFCGNCGTQIIY